MHILRSRRSFLATSLFGCTCLLALTGCGGGSFQAIEEPVLGGIKGQVTRGPIAPASQQGQTNVAPLPDVVITILTQNGSEVARQTTDSSGNYYMALSPGTYQVQGLAPNGSQSYPQPPAPQNVTVARQYVTVNVSYDTGVR